MAQTPEQQRAEDELAKAIEGYMAVHQVTEPGFALGTWVLLLSADGYTDETVGRTLYPRILPDTNAAGYHVVLGLIRLHLLYLEKETTEDDD